MTESSQASESKRDWTSRVPGSPGGLGFELTGPAFAVLADDNWLTPSVMEATNDHTWRRGAIEVRLVTVPAPDGSLSIFVEVDGVAHVSEVRLLDHDLCPRPAAVRNHVWFDLWGLQASTAIIIDGEDGGVFACYTNPFGVAELSGDHVRLSYRPGLDVRGAGGRDAGFVSDALVLGRFQRDGRVLRRESLVGRDIAGGRPPPYAKTLGPTPTSIEAGAARAIRAAVAARIPWQSGRARVAHWDWGENAYRLDPADKVDRAVFDRMSVICHEMGVEVVLLAPGPTDLGVAGMALGAAAGGPWQHIMWLGLGAAVLDGSWREDDEVRGGEEFLALFRDRGLRLAAYINPQVLWLNREDWRVVPGSVEVDLAAGLPDISSLRLSCLGVAELQDWLIETTKRFLVAYDLAGVSLDFVFWAPCHATDHGHEPGEVAKYAQWAGYQRLIAALAEIPDVWIEGLTGTQMILPWGTASMTHPHPVIGDNQPQWVPAWPDLSQDRANANYQRRTAFWMRNFAFVPSYKIAGQVTHQSNRLHEWPIERGWDWEGARFSLLSAIATGASSLVITFLPDWDEGEWDGVRKRDAAFFRQWVGFAREHADVLAKLEDLFEEARPGAIDGTIALDSDGRGFVFLANPDYVGREALVPLPPKRLLLELHPQRGRIWEGRVAVESHEVAVLEIVDEASIPLPYVIGALASVDGAGRVETAQGVPGSNVKVEVRQASGERRSEQLRFADDGVSPELGPWISDEGDRVELAELSGSVTITCAWTPGARLPDLLAELVPPVLPQGEEVLQPWSDPSRLRLFPMIIDPESVQLEMSIDGEDLQIHQAYVGTWEDVRDPQVVDNNLLGHYADVHERLERCQETGMLDRAWQVKLRIDGLTRGHLQGVYIAHLPRRRTKDFASS